MAVVVESDPWDVSKDGRVRMQVRWLTDTRDEAQRGIPSVYEGLGRTLARVSPFISREDGRYLVDATYEGMFEDQVIEQEEYELDYEEREAKIETFPDREILIREWGASEEDGKLVFTPTIKRPSSGGTGLGSQKTEEIPNPFYNLTTYPIEYAVARMRILRRHPPAELERAAGTVIDRIPPEFEYEGNAKSWLVGRPRRRKVGNVWEINVRYQQVDEFKDIEALLVLLQKTRTGGRGTGLTTTGLTLTPL